ncbi:hypothetical protein ABW19_dt0203369 [Dactylella cylindrospora]|nr:hypothetical protein ABW19_dt0203369 [Dactylella cylindrospora]
MTQLVNKLAYEAPDGKCYVTCGSLSKEIAAGQAVNRRPYSTILGHVYNQQVDVLLPDEICDLVQQQLGENLKPLHYHRIFMGLREILGKEFYNHYIRQGNILLLSDGRVDVDDVFCLYDGTLYLFLKKETYEKAGLVGKTATFGGRKKERWVVEYDLRAPHMVHGKKAFDRLAWSFTNVFKGQQSWLFCDLRQEAFSPSESPPDPAAIIGLSIPSTPRISTPTITHPTHPIKLATFTHSIPQKQTTSEYDRAIFYDWAYSLHEWLAMAALDANRLHAADNIDPLLSRYEPPLDSAEEHQPEGRIAKITWRGFLPAEYVSKIFHVLQENVPKERWFAMTVHGFQNSPVSWKGRQHGVVGGGMGGENLYTILRFSKDGSGEGGEEGARDVIMGGVEREANKSEESSGSRYIMWEVVGGRDEHS